VLEVCQICFARTGVVFAEIVCQNCKVNSVSNACNVTCGPKIFQSVDSGPEVTFLVQNCFIAWTKPLNSTVEAVIVRGCLTSESRDEPFHYKPNYDYNCSTSFSNSTSTLRCQPQCFDFSNQFRNLTYRTCYCAQDNCNDNFASAEANMVVAQNTSPKDAKLSAQDNNLTAKKGASKVATSETLIISILGLLLLIEVVIKLCG